MRSFDYIIVGAGSAGCLLAYRLVKNSKKTVLLIEEGGSNNNIWIQIPVGYFKTIFRFILLLIYFHVIGNKKIRNYS